MRKLELRLGRVRAAHRRICQAAIEPWQRLKRQTCKRERDLDKLVLRGAPFRFRREDSLFTSERDERLRQQEREEKQLIARWTPAAGSRFGANFCAPRGKPLSGGDPFMATLVGELRQQPIDTRRGGRTLFSAGKTSIERKRVARRAPISPRNYRSKLGGQRRPVERERESDLIIRERADRIEPLPDLIADPRAGLSESIQSRERLGLVFVENERALIANLEQRPQRRRRDGASMAEAKESARAAVNAHDRLPQNVWASPR